MRRSIVNVKQNDRTLTVGIVQWEGFKVLRDSKNAVKYKKGRVCSCPSVDARWSMSRL